MVISYGFDVHDINKLTQFSRGYNVVDGFKIRSISQDMTHPEYNTSVLDDLLHSNALFNAGSHRLLTQYMVSLFCKRYRSFEVHFILESDNDGVCNTPSNSGQGLGRSCMEILPSLKYKAFVYAERLCKEFPGIRTWLSDSDYFAKIWTMKCIRRVALPSLTAAENS
jgi:hypothetical protein